jgi:hypothetical protein
MQSRGELIIIVQDKMLDAKSCIVVVLRGTKWL